MSVSFAKAKNSSTKGPIPWVILLQPQEEDDSTQVRSLREEEALGAAVNPGMGRIPWFGHSKRCGRFFHHLRTEDRDTPNRYAAMENIASSELNRGRKVATYLMHLCRIS